MEKEKFNNLEREIQALERLLEEKKEALKSVPPEKKEEFIRSYTKERIETLEPGIKIGVSRPPAEKIPTTPASPLPSYLMAQDEQTKKIIEDLIALSEQKGLKTALNQLNKTNQPFLIDAFHDALTFKLLQELKKRNAI